MHGLQEKNNLTWRGSKSMRSLLRSNMKVTKIILNNILCTFLGFLRLITFNHKIGLKNMEPDHVKFFFCKSQT